MNAQFYIEGKYKFEHTSNRKFGPNFLRCIVPKRMKDNRE